MQIQALELKNYRNIAPLELVFDPGTNIFYGDNAQGKTNLLEALEICATTRSHRGSHDAEIIRFGEEEAHLRLTYQKKDAIPGRIDVHLRRNGKKGVAIDGSAIRRAADVYGQIHLVSFFPEDLAIIKNSPRDRRRFLDSQLCQLDRIYVHKLTDYNKILKQRNALLRDLRFDATRDAMLDVFDQQMLEAGTYLIEKRAEFLEALSHVVKEIHEELTEGKENSELVYEPKTAAADFAENLQKRRRTDIQRKLSTMGPHRDDFSVIANGIDMRRFGSQGQQRSAALSLKLSEIELVRQKTGETPILLLDDVLSELDRHRQKMLLQNITGTQTFLTCTGMDELVENDFPIDKIFHIENGKTVG